uniref:Uncharacterized protein n=1 Tax=Peronospora matthiolae TaxID=2874970 RepID=A0AAV1TZD9_9STRA
MVRGTPPLVQHPDRAVAIPVHQNVSAEMASVKETTSVVRGTPLSVQHPDRAVAIPVDQNVSAEMASVKEGRLHRWNILIVAAEVPVDMSVRLLRRHAWCRIRIYQCNTITLLL